MAPDFEKAMALMDAAHAQDPNIITVTTPSSSSPPSDTSLPASSSPPTTIPYELHYARKMTSYLQLHLQSSNRTSPIKTTSSISSPSPHLSLAVRAQHLRRWEIPRASYPAGKAGYFAWRTMLKTRQANQARDICLQCGYRAEDADRVAQLIAKEGLEKTSNSSNKVTSTSNGGKTEKEGGEGEEEEEEEDEVQILEDVACLVFLDDQFDAFERGHDEEKMLGILRKTWAKMGPRGRALALRIPMSDRCRDLVVRAVGGL